MDRNGSLCGLIIKISVALRKESVDRNCVGFSSVAKADRSLSARRAWIEILTFPGFGMEIESLSARRAWIEISLMQCQAKKYSGRSPQGERG